MVSGCSVAKIGSAHAPIPIREGYHCHGVGSGHTAMDNVSTMAMAEDAHDLLTVNMTNGCRQTRQGRG